MNERYDIVLEVLDQTIENVPLKTSHSNRLAMALITKIPWFF